MEFRVYNVFKEGSSIQIFRLIKVTVDQYRIPLLLPCSLLLHGYATICLTSHPMKGLWLVSLIYN